jgi:hypothetical protein
MIYVNMRPAAVSTNIYTKSSYWYKVFLYFVHIPIVKTKNNFHTMTIWTSSRFLFLLALFTKIENEYHLLMRP